MGQTATQILEGKRSSTGPRGPSLTGGFNARITWRALEAESIYILREAVAEFARPVMLYSIGKDSSVMLRLAQKAFFPGKNSPSLCFTSTQVTSFQK